MLEAGGWGLIGASSLLIGAIAGLTLRIPERVIGLILGFGAGTLISAVAFELTEEAYRLGGADTVALGLAPARSPTSCGDELHRSARHGGPDAPRGPHADATPPRRCCWGRCSTASPSRR